MIESDSSANAIGRSRPGWLPRRAATLVFASMSAMIGVHAPAASTFAQASTTAAPVTAPEATLDDFAGEFVGASIRLSLATKGSTLRGTLKVAEAAYPVIATVTGGSLRGTFEVPGEGEKSQLFNFTAAFDGSGRGKMTLTSDSVAHVLTRETPKPANPLTTVKPSNPLTKPEAAKPDTTAKPEAAKPEAAKPEPVKPETAKPSEAAPNEATATFVWPMGLRFEYPASWKREYKDGSLVFTPPTAKAGDAVSERIGLDFEPAPDVRSALDESVAEHLDAQVAAYGVKRTAAPEKLAVGSLVGALYTYDVQTEKGAVRMQVYVVVRDGVAYALSHLGMKAAVETNAKIVRQRFEKITFGSPQIDANLTGTWKQTKHGGSSGGYVGGSSTTNEKTITLSANGTFAMKTYSAGMTPAGGYSNEGETVRGKWAAAGGILVVVGDDGETFTFQYTVGGGGLEVKDASGKTEVWFR